MPESSTFEVELTMENLKFSSLYDGFTQKLNSYKLIYFSLLKHVSIWDPIMQKNQTTLRSVFLEGLRMTY